MIDTQVQLTWQPEVERPKLLPMKHLVIGGMGGSAFAGYALKFVDEQRGMLVHESYDLPQEAPSDALYVAISYSGNTEETLSFARAAQRQRLPLACIASGGSLATFAARVEAPLVVVPAGVAPRHALGYLLRALLVLVGAKELLQHSSEFKPDEEKLTQEAVRLSGAISDTIPVVYASARNELIARIWQMVLNEGAKIPAFMRLVPASNHYDIQGYDPRGPHEKLAHMLLPMLCTDNSDDPRIARRMVVLKELFEEYNYRAIEMPLVGTSRTEQLLYTWALSMYTAEHFAKAHGVDPNSNELVESFKKKL